uniref:Uncharacterized protein n=1 Tax=Setaria digitata TaxID=48799 RepID=A0A915PDB0_9BILA
MGCRFSKTNSAEVELDSDAVDVASGTVNRLLLSNTEYFLDSKPIVKSDIAESLNSAAVSLDSSVSEMITSTDSVKNAYPLVRRDTPVRSTFSNRITVRSKVSLDPEVHESNSSNPVYVNKPIKEIESASQADFFRMLDEKIAQVIFSLKQMIGRLAMPKR